MDGLLLRLVALFALVTSGLALQCFVCNSHEDDGCYELTGDSKQFLTDCSSIAADSRANYTLCRKLHMFMDQDFGEANPHEDRVHRDCGYVDDEALKRKGDCYYRSGYNTRTWVCSCKEDGCNGAPHAHSALTGITLAVAAATVLIRNFNIAF